MLPLLLSVVLAADSPVEEPPRAALWVNLAPLIANTLSGGGSVAVAPRLALVVDAGFSPTKLRIEHDCADSGRAAWSSIGLAVRPFGAPHSVTGFFLLPKFVGRVAWTEGMQGGRRPDGSECFRPYANGSDTSLGVGVAAGWDWVLWRHLFVGVSGGVGALACFNCATYASDRRGNLLIPAIDLGLRLGVAL